MAMWHTVAGILGLAVITVVTRSFFLLPKRELPLPAWVTQGCATRRSRHWRPSSRRRCC